MNVCLISTYFAQGGVSKYTRSLSEALGNRGVNVVVLSDRSKEDPRTVKISILPCWDKSLLYPFQILKALLRIRTLDLIHIQHEFFLYGNSLSTLFFPLLLVMVRLLHKPVVVTLHGVIPLDEVNDGFKEDNFLRFPIALLRVALIFLTKVIVQLSDGVIVHTAFFKSVLMNHYECPPQKVNVIPHGIDERLPSVSSFQAKERLGLKGKTIIFTFGYLAKYKGIDTLIAAFSKLKKEEDYVLIVGGREHPRLSHNVRYRNFIRGLHELAYSSVPGRVIFTGYIDDEDLNVYLCAADLVVFCHRYAMSFSGPLALAIGYAKPIMASDIEPFREFIPFEQALFAKDSQEELAVKIKQILADNDLKRRMFLWFNEVRKRNSWERIALQTFVLYQNLLNLRGRAKGLGISYR